MWFIVSMQITVICKANVFKTKTLIFTKFVREVSVTSIHYWSHVIVEATQLNTITAQLFVVDVLTIVLVQIKERIVGTE